MSSHTFDGRHSPIESISGSTSPQIFKPASFVTARPRASSINSTGSNHSNNRSLSIASLESPRNSIVSIDDPFLRITRNSSTASLNSMSGANGSTLTSPNSKTNVGPSHINPLSLNNQLVPSSSSYRDRAVSGTRLKSKNFGIGLFSDEDSDLESKPLTRTRSRRSSGDRKEKNALKKDYRFKFNETLKILKTPTTRVDMKMFQDPTPSPLSTSTLDMISKKPAEPMRALPAPEISSKKKLSVSKSAPNPLKKNLIFSKDVRLELLANKDFESYHTKLLAGPKAEKDKPRPDFPILSTLKQQNKLISQLNQKWNKTVTNKTNETSNDKPRLKRRYSSSDEETDYN